MRFIQKTFLLIIESLGVGEAPDAEIYGDKNANTLGHIADYSGGLRLPTFARLGLGNLTYVKGMIRSEESIGYYGKCRQISDGKDNLSGHWEISGFSNPSLYHTDPKGFFPQFIEKLEKEIGKKCIYNFDFGPDKILERYYYDHLTEKACIVYYNPKDMTLEIAAHPDVAPEEEFKKLIGLTHETGMYYGFTKTRGTMISHDKNHHIIKKVILRLSMKPSQVTLFASMKESGIPVYFMGNRQDIFDDNDFTKIIKTQNDQESMDKLIEMENTGAFSNEQGQSLIYAVFSNMSGAKSKDIKSYSDYLKNLDVFLQRFIRTMNTSDILIISSSHGDDPSFGENVHTREYLPILAFSRVLGVRSTGNLGVRRTLMDIADTISDIYGLESHYGGDSFWNFMLSQI